MPGYQNLVSLILQFQESRPVLFHTLLFPGITLPRLRNQVIVSQKIRGNNN